MLVWGPCFESPCSKALEVKDAGLAGTGTNQGCGSCLTPRQGAGAGPRARIAPNLVHLKTVLGRSFVPPTTFVFITH